MTGPFDTALGLYSTQGVLGTGDPDLVHEADFVLHEPQVLAYPRSSLPEDFVADRDVASRRYELLQVPFTMPPLRLEARFVEVRLRVLLDPPPERLLRMDPGRREVEVVLPPGIDALDLERWRSIGSLERRSVVTTYSGADGAPWWRFRAQPEAPLRGGAATAALLLELPVDRGDLAGSVWCELDVARPSPSGAHVETASLERAIVFTVPLDVVPAA